MTARKKSAAPAKSAKQAKGAKQAKPGTPAKRAATGRATQGQVRAWALALPEAHEGSHMGRADLRVRDKIFATLPADGQTVNMKSTPANLDALVRSAPDVFKDVWAGRWFAVRLDGIDAAEVRALLEDAWRLTAPKTLVAAFERGSSDASDPMDPRFRGGDDGITATANYSCAQAVQARHYRHAPAGHILRGCRYHAGGGYFRYPCVPTFHP